MYDEKGRKIDIAQFYEAIRKRKKKTAKGEDEIPFKVVRGPRGHRGSKGRKGPPGDPGVSQNLDRSVDANVTIDTAGLEKTFREMGESMKEVFTSQQIFNRTMKDTLEASTVVISVKRVSIRCQDDIFSRIELISSNVLSSRVTNYKNDIHEFL